MTENEGIRDKNAARRVVNEPTSQKPRARTEKRFKAKPDPKLPKNVVTSKIVHGYCS